MRKYYLIDSFFYWYDSWRIFVRVGGNVACCIWLTLVPVLVFLQVDIYCDACVQFIAGVKPEGQDC